MVDKIKIVKYGGRLNPSYKEIGEIDLIKFQAGEISENEEICIDIDDLMVWINRK